MDFEAAFETFLEGCKEKVAAYNERFATVNPPSLVVEPGRRYIRIVSQITTNQRSAWAFVDKTNGDVLKPASWKTPAKHARGNVFDDHNGLKWIGPYGPAYLR
jgi:hypothetical protein